MPVRSERLTTFAGLMLIVAAVWSGWLAWRDSEAKHVHAAQERTAAARERAMIRAELRGAAQNRADMEARVARIERIDAEFRDYAIKMHDETHRLLRDVLRRLDAP